MKKFLMVLLALLMLLPATAPASALSCVPFEDQLNNLHAILRGKVTSVEQVRKPGYDTIGETSHRVLVQVDRYFKGDGPAQVEILWDASWDNTPPSRGAEVLLGLFRDESGFLHHGPCNLKFIYGRENGESFQRIMARLGEGHPPTASPSPMPSFPGYQGEWILYSAFALFGGLIIASRLMRKGK